MDESQNDVNTQTDTATVTDSSSGEQTSAEGTQTENPTENGVTTEQPAAEDKTVPYDRFKEVNDNFRATQAELKAIRDQQSQIADRLAPQQPTEVVQAKEQLKSLIKEMAPELGFVSKEEIQRQEAVNAVQNEHTRLASKYSGKPDANGVVLPKYDSQAVTDYAIQLGMTNAKGLEVAYNQMHSAEIMNARIAAGIAKSRGVQTETSNGTGSANTGISSDDLKKAAQEGDPNAVHLLLKRRLASK